MHFSCWGWEISDEVGETIWATIQDQAAEEKRIGHFCFFGSKIGSWVGGGSNCTDWMNGILRNAGATELGQPKSFENLLDIVEQQSDRHVLAIR